MGGKEEANTPSGYAESETRQFKQPNKLSRHRIIECAIQIIRQSLPGQRIAFDSPRNNIILNPHIEKHYAAEKIGEKFEETLGEFWWKFGKVLKNV